MEWNEVVLSDLELSLRYIKFKKSEGKNSMWSTIPFGEMCICALKTSGWNSKWLEGKENF